MIQATDKPWNSATTLYIARKIEQLAAGRRLAVLDLGCGAGGMLKFLLDYGHEFYGCDLYAHKLEQLQNELGSRLNSDFAAHFRKVEDERIIPFRDQSFDVIYANQVFEHVRFIECMYAECARVLRPGGTLITLFPLATYPVELHARVPFVHWLPPGKLRRAYLRPFFSLRLRRRRPGLSARQTAAWWDENLRKYEFYRFLNEFEMLSEAFFESYHSDTHAYVQAKVDLMRASSNVVRRTTGRLMGALHGSVLDYLVTHGFGATLVHQDPKMHKNAGASRTRTCHC
jgi:SAM-dependent methyltransferase